ncbi:hypothetical protein [Xenorhabdus innexi]|uniref:Uncharacterized protein n=1 Tax=Xenorhabdus innexi TaxID=290109 RepID=A0A1N6MXI0_9GAMM|nr:hypothetical protein [Xenorhabdus innexi]PHM30349.1 hypothetical protein Xinn_03323 [Xenorhabdus innexi]SIP73429.1 conserved membrane hypothetical protein [Xenorhabdus innexi]
MSKKYLTYYIVSNIFALALIILNSFYICFNLYYFNFTSYEIIIASILIYSLILKKALTVALAFYVIILNEIARRKKKYISFFDFMKGKKDIVVEKIDLFIIFSFSLSFIYFSFLSLSAIYFILNNYIPFITESITYDQTYIISCIINLLIIIVSIIPLFRARKIYKNQKNKKEHIII